MSLTQELKNLAMVDIFTEKCYFKPTSNRKSYEEE